MDVSNHQGSTHRRRYSSVPGSLSSVVDAYFSSDNSNNSWAFASSVASLPEPSFKKNQAQNLVPLDLSGYKPYIKYRSSKIFSPDYQGGTTSTTLTARLPILNPVEYDLWLMRIEQYFLMTNYSLWEVILNGNKVLKRQVEETEQEYEATNAEEKQDRRNEMKARGTLLMALPNKDQ
ncbi:hypothetical protein Tco_0551765 [Tanacetum coccineum]